MTHQTFEQWLNSPVQGAIPVRQVDSMMQLEASLQLAHSWLIRAKKLLAESESQYSAVSEGIADAIHGTEQALNHITDAPDDDASSTLYDVATEASSIKGKVHPPTAAFDAIDITNDPNFEF